MSTEERAEVDQPDSMHEVVQAPERRSWASRVVLTPIFATMTGINVCVAGNALAARGEVHSLTGKAALSVISLAAGAVAIPTGVWTWRASRGEAIDPLTINPKAEEIADPRAE